MKKQIILYTEGDSREDGNIFYCDYLVLESATLAFNELFFSDTSLTGDQVYDAAVAAGYVVERLDPVFVEVSEV
jgi:hypothetical protein